MMETKERQEAILNGLNPEQRRAVECVSGPVLIVAGAGSGKTKVLTSRVAYILAQEAGPDGQKTDPSRVMALTFTKKAAEEMKERISLLVGRRAARGVVMGTFHSVFIRFLRDYCWPNENETPIPGMKYLDYPKGFTIYDRSDSESAVKACVKELNLDEKLYKPREVLARISFAKNGLFTPEAYHAKAEFQQQDDHNKKPFIWKIYQLYQEKLKLNGVMDFDDILLNMNILLRDNEQAWKEISSRFDYIMVDEYQDTNYAQYLILKKLAWQHHNLCVVGDDSQSIYAFRGAQIQNILNFQKDYPESKIIRLERNYRSTRNIVDAANSVIAHNEGRIPKKCFSEGEPGEKIRLIKSYTEQEEAVQIVSGIITRVMQEKAEYSDFAVLYRTNSQSRALEEAFRRKNIPYMIYSGNSFFDRAEIKDMMAWFKLCVNVNDDESFKRAVGKPSRGIGDTSLSALNEVARAHRCSLFAAVACEDYLDFGLRPAAMQKIRAFRDLIDTLAIAAAKGDAFEVARRIYDESGLYAFFKSDTSIEGMARTSNLDELLNSVQAFKEERLEDILADMEIAGQAGNDADVMPDPDSDSVMPDTGSVMPDLIGHPITLADFLETTSLLSNADTEDKDDNGTNKVALMTIHSAKGLEFPYVYIAGAEENLFPSGGMMASPADIEEERRLFYVAVTRAKKAVAVSFASTRMRNGKHESNAPSRFIREIDSEYVANPLPAPGFDDDDDGDSGMPFWFRNGAFGSHAQSQASHARPDRASRGGYSTRTVGYNTYGRSGPARSYPSAPKPEPAPAMTTRVVQPTVKPDIIDPNFVPVPMTELYEGERVEHNRFGPGLIKEITGEFPELKAVIDFDNYGSKVLLLKYAKLRPEKK